MTTWLILIGALVVASAGAILAGRQAAKAEYNSKWWNRIPADPVMVRGKLLARLLARREVRHG